MSRPSLLLPRLSSYAVLAIGLVLLLGWGEAASPFAVTFRFGNETIGPEPALDLVLPSVGANAAADARLGKRPAGAVGRAGEIWVTLAASPATKRIAELIRAASDRRPVTGTCEIAVAAQVGAAARRYTIAGCFAKAIEPAGPAQRVTLGYSAISISE